ncbi:MAG: phasin family protein [Acidiphilium sp.]
MTAKTKSAEMAQATATIDEGKARVAAGFETTLASMKDGMEKAARGFETQQARMKENMVKAMKTTEELMAFGQGNFEAFMKASQIFGAGLQGLSRHLAESAQISVEETVATAKAMAGVRSVKDALDLQAAYARGVMEKAVAESGRMTDASLKLTEQTIAPLTARVTLAVEKFGAAL